MTYDMEISAEQALALANWVIPAPGETLAPVRLRKEGDRLIASQGDDTIEIGPTGAFSA